MTVSSTEFQQNVGHYLGLVEKGKKVFVQKHNSANKLFEVRKATLTKAKEEKSKEVENFLAKLDSFKLEFDYDGDSVKLQRRLRS